MKAVLTTLLEEKKLFIKNCLYDYTQVNFTYHSNKIEGCQLDFYQVAELFDKDFFTSDNAQIIKLNDIFETINHFKAFDFILDNITNNLSIEFIKELHFIIKQNCYNAKVIGDFKQCENIMGNIRTTPVKLVQAELEKLLDEYNKKQIDLNGIIDFHYKFERIHPFEDGNGRVGRLLMFKECLKNNIMPFIIKDEIKTLYYRGLSEYINNKNFLRQTCLSCQNDYKIIFKEFEIIE
ncbi:Fic family protein [Campylobacter sp. LR185c]|uniref:Fic family protein n=1 Tax=Campylobacter sp. LR185c TaxID=2014525 RepID=UPI001237DC7C|nr:Fic family protein [Campylobacter sp. LR185c]KAA6227944.1 Fic family protein [Campylobacter sp. LR185c]KAA8604368.1 hypothetical protein CGP82_02265 [Campylobacter sp. LR185c]